jgi:Ni/Fe-hydrogenase subunit HybB-like protein
MAEESIRLAESKINDDILRPLRYTGPKFFIAVAILLAIIGWGAISFGYQMLTGMGVAGIGRPVGWGLYIATFVFWIGLSHSGTLISAILRITQAEWRRPITRGAEAMTVFTIMVGALFPIIHLGRSWRFYWLIPYPNERGLWPNFRSPVLWDLMAITTYLTGSIIYFYLPMIPDMALARDKSTGWRRTLYSVLSLGWRGSYEQWKHLHRTLGLLMVLIIPVAVSVHSIVSWDFAMTMVPIWHSTIFAPYFVAGAIFSGTALVITIMTLLRRLLNLGEYLRPAHFDALGKLLLAMSIIWFYFWFADALTVWYGSGPDEREVLLQTVLGPWFPLWVTMLLCNFVIPFGTLIFRRARTSIVLFFVSLIINVGMYVERVLIVVPPLSMPRLPFNWGSYAPTWVELSIIAASFAGFSLLYLLFTKIFPVMAIWEVKEGELLRSTREVAGVKVHTISRVE